MLNTTATATTATTCAGVCTPFPENHLKLKFERETENFVCLFAHFEFDATHQKKLWWGNKRQRKVRSNEKWGWSEVHQRLCGLIVQELKNNVKLQIIKNFTTYSTLNTSKETEDPAEQNVCNQTDKEWYIWLKKLVFTHKMIFVLYGCLECDI